MKIGVLALQGDFSEHIVVLKQLGVETAEVRLAGQLDDLNGLIIPGGELTTIGKLAEDFGLMEPLRAFGRERAIWGTCAGAIFLSKDARRTQPLLKLMDITVERNAFGSQADFLKRIWTLPRCNRLPPPIILIMLFLSVPLSSNRSAAAPASFRPSPTDGLSRPNRANCSPPPSIPN